MTPRNLLIEGLVDANGASVLRTQKDTKVALLTGATSPTVHVPKPAAAPKPGVALSAHRRVRGMLKALSRSVPLMLVLIHGGAQNAAGQEIPLNIHFFDPANRIDGRFSWTQTAISPSGSYFVSGSARLVKPADQVMFVPGAWQDTQDSVTRFTSSDCSHSNSNGTSISTMRAGISAPQGTPPTFIYFGVRFEPFFYPATPCYRGPPPVPPLTSRFPDTLAELRQDPERLDRWFTDSVVVERDGDTVRTTTIKVDLILNCDCEFDSPTAIAGRSAFEIPEPSDTVFVTSGGPFPAASCAFRKSGPIEFDINVTRVLGEVDGEGYLLLPDKLKANGVVAPTAVLTLPVFDVDSDYPGTFFAPESDRVSINGHTLRRTTPDGSAVGLAGTNNAWTLNTFEVPIELIRFPTQASELGSKPEPQPNTIRIDIDVANASLPDYWDTEVWCTAVDWAALEVKAMSPTVLVHGNNSDPIFWNRHDFSLILDQVGLPYDGCFTCKHPLKLPTSFVANNARTLSGLIPAIVRTFGADSYHIVAHSKGGLDSRHYLIFQPSDLELLSLTTLSTPHNGSVLADILVASGVSLDVSRVVKFSGFPTFTGLIAGLKTLMGADDGAKNLTTWFAAPFNAGNVGALPAADYYQVAADADRNGSETIDIEPEVAALRSDAGLIAGSLLTKGIVNTLYQNLRQVQEITVDSTRREAYVPSAFIPGTYSVEVIRVLRRPTRPNGNDVLVTIPSGLGLAADLTQGISRRSTDHCILDGANGRNHSDVADAGVARIVIPWLQRSELTRGDLRGSGLPVPPPSCPGR